MKFDNETEAILGSELAYKKMLEETEFRANETAQRDVIHELRATAWNRQVHFESGLEDISSKQ
jgi:hypothetical protein